MEAALWGKGTGQLQESPSSLVRKLSQIIGAPMARENWRVQCRKTS